MLASVCISGQKIHIILGRLSLSPSECKVAVIKALSCDIPDRFYSGGSVTDSTQFSWLIKSLWADNGLPKCGVSLILGGSYFVTKLFDMPDISVQKALNYIPREFAAVGRSRDPVYSYFTILKNKTVRQQRVFAAMAERSSLGSFIDIFKKAGLKLISIDSAQSAAVRLLSKHPLVMGHTCLVQHIDGDELTSYLFVSGLYVYSGKSRHIAGSPADTAAEIARSVSGILQFAKAQDIEQSITDVYLLGIDDDCFDLCEGSILHTGSFLNVRTLSGVPFIRDTKKNKGTDSYNNEQPDCFFKLFNAFIGFDKIYGRAGFIYQQKRDALKETRRRKFIQSVLPFAAVIFIFLFWFMKLDNKRQALSADLKQAEYYLGSDKLNSAVSLYERYSINLDDILARTSAADKAAEAIDSYPLMNSDTESALRKASFGYVDIALTSYDASTGLIGLICTAEDESRIYNFIEKLKGEAILAKVVYTGYEISNDGSYKVSLSCYLDPDAGRKVDANRR